MDQKDGWGNSNFNALQLSLHRRVSSGLNWGTEYMWSHGINDNSLGGGEGTQPQSALCRRCDRGNSSQDVRHTIASNFSYELPFGPGQRMLSAGPASKIFGGWEMNGICTARTGRMLTIGISRSSSAMSPTAIPRTSGPTSSPVSRSTRKADRRSPSGSTLPRSAIPAKPALGATPDAPLQTGPGLVQLDFSLQKKTHLTREQGGRVPSGNVQHL